MARDDVQGFAETRVHRRLAARDRDVMVAERLGLNEKLFQYVERQEEVFIVLGVAAIDAAEAVRAIEIADVVQLNSDAWHKGGCPEKILNVGDARCGDELAGQAVMQRGHSIMRHNEKATQCFIALMHDADTFCVTQK